MIIKNILKIICTLALIVGLISCCTKKQINLKNSLYNNLPHSSAVYIEMTPNIYELQKEFPPEMYEAYQMQYQVTASGVFVDYEGSSHVLTVSHFCADEQRMLKEDNFFDQSVDTVSIHIYTTAGEIHEMEIVKHEPSNDLCLLKFKCECEGECNWKELTVAEKPPKIGDKVYTISRPYGVYSPETSLVFDGRYGGTADAIYDLQLIPAAPGSSGAPVINNKGEIIGITSMAMYPYHEVVLAVRIPEIRDFLGVK